MKTVYGYVRVSDQKQVDGASLTEQERAITEYAKKNNLNIIQWFRETKTAAKRGRPHFDKMLNQLKEGKANGAIIHKIDRSARNLHDWAAIGDLIDNKIEVHFAHESLDMTERGGRLSADIQAVMASDYVRNLRQEAIKGLYGRLKQGLWPFRAPVGYLDNGKGKVKTIDPKKYLLIQKLFELYVFEDHTIRSLAEEMNNLGLRNFNENKYCKNGISSILNNPFYVGDMKIKGKLYKGKHEPIISKRLYQKAQAKLHQRIKTRGIRHNYLFRGIIRCHFCERLMTGESQKGNIYYRCSKKGCKTTSIREDFAEQLVLRILKNIEIPYEMLNIIFQDNAKKKINEQILKQNALDSLKLQLSKLKLQEDKLLNCHLEELISKEQYKEKRVSLHSKIETINESISSLDLNNESFSANNGKLIELVKSLSKNYVSGTLAEKKQLLKTVFSNFRISRRKSVITCYSPYRELINSTIPFCGGLSRDSSNTFYMDRNDSFFIKNPDALVLYFNKNISLLTLPNIAKEDVEICLEKIKRRYLEDKMSFPLLSGDGIISPQL